MASSEAPSRYKHNLLNAKSTVMASEANCALFFSAWLVHLDAKATGFVLSLLETCANIALSPDSWGSVKMKVGFEILK